MSVTSTIDVLLDRNFDVELTFCSLAASCKSSVEPGPTSRSETEVRIRAVAVMMSEQLTAIDGPRVFFFNLQTERLGEEKT